MALLQSRIIWLEGLSIIFLMNYKINQYQFLLMFLMRIYFSNISVDVDGPPIIGWVGKIDDHKDWHELSCKFLRLYLKNTQMPNFGLLADRPALKIKKAQEVFDFC